MGERTYPCSLCGNDVPPDRVAQILSFCSGECWHTARELEGLNFPIALGHAIRRFCRHAEVDAMAGVVCDVLDRCGPVEDYIAATRALRLLADLALKGAE